MRPHVTTTFDVSLIHRLVGNPGRERVMHGHTIRVCLAFVSKPICETLGYTTYMGDLDKQIQSLKDFLDCPVFLNETDVEAIHFFQCIQVPVWRTERDPGLLTIAQAIAKRARELVNETSFPMSVYTVQVIEYGVHGRSITVGT